MAQGLSFLGGPGQLIQKAGIPQYTVLGKSKRAQAKVKEQRKQLRSQVQGKVGGFGAQGLTAELVERERRLQLSGRIDRLRRRKLSDFITL